ncbi:MAG: hypothetical protein ACFE8E_12465, partial [Candidatus Hodarchaeota archaeon]
NHPTADWYRLYVDGWNWKDKELLHGGVPDRDDVWYNLPMDPTGNTWNPSVWMIPTPVVTYLEELSYFAGTSASGSTITVSSSDVESYEAIYTFDEDLGVTDLFQIKNSLGTVIFEVILMEFSFPAGSEFEWRVTKLNDVELENVLGGTWETDIESFFGPGCTEVGVKMKRHVTDILLSGNLWYLYTDVWDWTSHSYGSEPNYTTSFGLYCDPEDGFWGGWMWVTPFPPYYYLVGRSYAPGSQLSGLVVTQNNTAVEDYQLKYTYDAILGILKTVQLLNDESIVIFEYRLVSAAVSPGGIPGFDTFLIISSVFLMVGLISLISIRKRIKN